MLSTEMYQALVDELAPTLLYLILYFQGEPYLHPNFFNLISYAHKKKIYIATSTNAHYLDSKNAKKTVESGLDRLIVSMDGTDQREYEKYRIGGNYQKVVDGIKELVYWKKKLKSKTPHIILQFLVFKHNEHQVEEVKKLGKELGVDKVALKTAQIYGHENGSELLPENSQFSRYSRNGDGSWHIKNKLFDHCWKMWHSSVITWDGKVVPCCFDKDASHVLGDATSGFKQIWESADYNRFRGQVLGARNEIDICKNCTEGTKVWI